MWKQRVTVRDIFYQLIETLLYIYKLFYLFYTLLWDCQVEDSVFKSDWFCKECYPEFIWHRLKYVLPGVVT